MSLGNGPTLSKRWRPLEQLGLAIGIVMGGLVLVCVWSFALVQHIIGVMPIKRLRTDRLSP